MSRLNLTCLRRMKIKQNKIAMLTAYDSSFSHILDESGVDAILVGDSLGMVVQGHESTLPVRISDMVYHTQNVVRGSDRAFIITDMPFMSYSNTEQAIKNATSLMAKGGAQMVKLEGGAIIVDIVAYLTKRGIPVCGHLGLLPQSIHRLGDYQVQGRDHSDADQLMSDAKKLQQAGADMLVLECVPAALGEKVTAALDIPVIGIGAGCHCDGQVLVLYDMLGITSGKRPRFNHDFLADAGTIPAAVAHYVQQVKDGQFPTSEQNY